MRDDDLPVSFAAAGQAMMLDELCRPLKLALFVLGLAVMVAVCWTIHRRVQTMLMRSDRR